MWRYRWDKIVPELVIIEAGRWYTQLMVLFCLLLYMRSCPQWNSFLKNSKWCVFSIYLSYKKFQFLHGNALQTLSKSNLVDKCFFPFPLDDFKPASIDTSCEGELQVGKGDEVTITLPHIPVGFIPLLFFLMWNHSEPSYSLLLQFDFSPI